MNLFPSKFLDLIIYLFLSIWNEGTLPLGLSLEDLKREHSSRPRNPIIANACFLGGYIDTWGRGTLKIINSCKEAGLPAPELKEINGGVAVTLFTHKDEQGKASEKSSEKSSEKILELIKVSPEISVGGHFKIGHLWALQNQPLFR